MLFKHPEILYALFLLIIPVLVHLFQLRKFREERFTNVKFLKKANLKTRKSSQIKKWLILCTRLLLLTSIIIAFAQPYFPASKNALKSRETVIYFDNSFSLQAKGTNGILLKRNLQELLEHLPKKESFSLFLNNQEFKNVTLNDIREQLQEISYSPIQLDWKSVQLKAENLFSENPGVQKDFIVISDFQKQKEPFKIRNQKNINTNLVQLLPETRNNISIDSAFISEKTLDEYILEIHISGSGKTSGEVPVSVYNGENLLGRKTINLERNETGITSFKLPSIPVEDGKVSVEDAGLQFDNQLFFSINKTEPINVAVIGQADASFFSRIYREPEFNLEIFPTKEIDFNKLSDAELIILNELEEIPFGLQEILKKMVAENHFMVIIPSENANLQNYNSFFKNFGLPVFREKQLQEKFITEISFSNPLFKNVFEEKVENFEYPKVQSYFTTSRNGIAVLEFENQQSFLFQQQNIFVFTAAINVRNSNFQSSPLIVPVYYNLGNLALTPSPLYYYLGEENSVDVKVSLEKDEILKLSSENYSFIPLQQSFQNKVEIQLKNIPENVGNFNIDKEDSVLKKLSFNINRAESKLKYKDLRSLENGKLFQNISDVFQKMKSETQTHSLWKWFVIFALLFLLTEMVILKYYK